jgi:hypothetical protein
VTRWVSPGAVPTVGPKLTAELPINRIAVPFLGGTVGSLPSSDHQVSAIAHRKSLLEVTIQCLGNGLQESSLEKNVEKHRPSACLHDERRVLEQSQI